MKRLIVNADDFGLTESINRGILAAHRDGILTSASLLANGSAFDHAIASSRPFPRLSLGVHLNLSAGTPLAPAARIPTLVDERGQLYLHPVRLAIEILRRRVSLGDVRAEFRAQMIKVLDAGVTPTHLDGHLHVHVLPQLAPIVIEIAREFCICNVRCPAEDLDATLPLLWQAGGAAIAPLKRSAIAYAVTSLATRFRAQLLMAGLACTDSFYGLAQTGFLNTRTLTELLALIPHGGGAELMCHPGYVSAAVELAGGDLTSERETEVLALTAPETKEILARMGIRLMNFAELHASLPSRDIPGH